MLHCVFIETFIKYKMKIGRMKVMQVLGNAIFKENVL